MQIEKAFAAGHDPALELANVAAMKPQNEHLVTKGDEELDQHVVGSWARHRRQEQDLIDRIIQGRETGYYFVLLGPKVSH